MKNGKCNGRTRLLYYTWLPLAAFNLFLLFILALHVGLNRLPDSVLGAEAESPGLAKPVMRTGPATYMHLRNVKFHWNDEIFVRTAEMTVRGEPLGGNRHIDFGYPEAFLLNIIGGTVIADLEIVARLFNTRVFNYPGAPLRNLTLSAENEPGRERRINLSGEMKFGIWIAFKVLGGLSVDTVNNRLVLTTDKITAVGLPFARTLMSSVGLTLEKLVNVAGRPGIEIRGNNIIINPMALFPPPRLSGRLTSVALDDDTIRLTFLEQERVSFPARPIMAKNDILLYRGELQISRMRMINPVVQVIDITPGDFLEFNVARYFKQINESEIRILKSEAVLIYMPDYGKLISGVRETGKVAKNK